MSKVIRLLTTCFMTQLKHVFFHWQETTALSTLTSVSMLHVSTEHIVRIWSTLISVCVQMDSLVRWTTNLLFSLSPITLSLTLWVNDSADPQLNYISFGVSESNYREVKEYFYLTIRMTYKSVLNDFKIHVCMSLWMNQLLGKSNTSFTRARANACEVLGEAQ